MENGEVDRLLDAIETAGHFNAASFVDQWSGNVWDLPDSEFGWKRKAQEWGSSEGLVEPFRQADTGQTFGVLTERGRLFKEELHKRGITIFVKP